MIEPGLIPSSWHRSLACNLFGHDLSHTLLNTLPAWYHIFPSNHCSLVVVLRKPYCKVSLVIVCSMLWRKFKRKGSQWLRVWKMHFTNYQNFDSRKITSYDSLDTLFLSNNLLILIFLSYFYHFLLQETVRTLLMVSTALVNLVSMVLNVNTTSTTVRPLVVETVGKSLEFYLYYLFKN